MGTRFGRSVVVAAVVVAAGVIGGVVLVRHTRSAGGGWPAGGWSETGAPDVGELDRIVAVSRARAYAFTVDEEGTAADMLSRALEWNGRQWRRATGPAYQRALAAYGARHRWAATAAPVSYGTGPQRQDVWKARSTLTRWDGDHWRAVAELPAPAGPGQRDGGAGVGTPIEVSASGDSDVWVVGTAIVLSGPAATKPPNRPYAAHWNGRTLVETPLPPLAPDAEVRGVLAESPTRAWAVGWYHGTGASGRGEAEGWLLRWDGTAWHQVPLPAGTPSLKGFVRSGDALYAYGDGLLRRAGDGWEPIDVPTGEAGFAATGDGHGGVWLAYRQYLHYSSGHWTEYRMPHGGTFTSVSALDRVPGTGALWAVGGRGHYIEGSDGDHTYSALVQRFGGG
ncbi:MAG: hypothetical protein ACJ73S_02610 [Mycobacteriales bacterium]